MTKIIHGDGVTAEELAAMYFDADALKEPPYRIYRMDNRGQRWYYRILPDGKPVFYQSVTSICNATLPTSPFLIDWIANMGREEARKYVELRAHYGTILHASCAKLLIEKTISLDDMESTVELYRIAHRIEAEDTKPWPDDLRKDVLAFARFIIDVNFKPLAIEIGLCHPDGYAGAIDLVGDMDIVETGFFGERYKTGPRAGEPKETKRTSRARAVVDIKSGKKGFFESHEIQLQAYGELFNHNFPETPVERMYNWAPGEWRTTPSYKLKDQTEAPSLYKFKHLIALAKEMREKREKQILQIQGVIDLQKGIERNYTVIGFEEAVSKNHETTDSPPETELLSLDELEELL